MDEPKAARRKRHIEVQDELRMLNDAIVELPQLVAELKSEGAAVPPATATQTGSAPDPTMQPFATVWKELPEHLAGLRNRIQDQVAALRELLL